MNPRVLAFVAAVDVAGVVGLLLLLPSHAPAYALGTFLVSTLAALTAVGPIRVPSTKISVNVTDAFILAALGAFGPGPACVVGGIAGVAAILGKTGPRKPLRIVFNIGNHLCATAAAGAVYQVVGGFPGSPVGSQVVPMLLATTVYLLCNTVLVAGVIYLDTGRGFWSAWSESALWSAVATYAGMTLAAIMIAVIGWLGPAGLALGLPPAFVLARFMRTHKDRHDRAQERIHHVQDLNAVLEEKVAERTQELQQALSKIELANEELVRTNRRLEEANRAKSMFLANVSHELRTPLNAVIGFSDLLCDPSYGTLNAEQEDFVKDIQDSGEHLLRLITDILDLSKIEAGKMEASLRPVEVRRALQVALGMVRPQAVAKGLRLDLDCDEDFGSATLDAGMFRQVVLNLLSNAVKFTEQGGVRVVARADGADLLLQVRDTGIGIPADDLERVFKEFYQVDGSYSRTYEGTGLGLALVRRMVELQHGTVTAESTPGEGSSFICRFREALVCPEAQAREVAGLPAPDRTADVPDAASVEPPAELVPVVEEAEPETPPLPETPTILLVDDDPVQRRLARNVLKSNGYVVIEAGSGEELLEKAEHERAHLVLLDVDLPGIDGLETTRRLRLLPRWGDVPVVALAEAGAAASEPEVRDAGGSGILAKPIRLAVFPGQVRAYLPKTPAAPSA